MGSFRKAKMSGGPGDEKQAYRLITARPGAGHQRICCFAYAPRRKAVMLARVSHSDTPAMLNPREAWR